MRKFFVIALASAMAVGAVSAFAGQVPDNFTGTFKKKPDKHAVMGFHAVFKNNNYTKVNKFDWDGLTCAKGGEGFTGGVSGKPFKVKHGEFHGKRPVQAKATSITAKIEGEFMSKVKAKGSIKLSGGPSGGQCDWKDSWKANAGG